MDDEEYTIKYTHLRILKSIQDYLKSEGETSTAVYPINVPDDLLYQMVQHQGAENADKLIQYVFKLGLTIWSEKLYMDIFGSQANLEDFIKLMKKRNKK
ncbi:hypothetical protein ACFL9T_20380 [Thermodesulfobacteriota bacterium]